MEKRKGYLTNIIHFQHKKNTMQNDGHASACKVDLTYDRDRKPEQTVSGLYFACIGRAWSLDVVHLIVNNSENINMPYDGERTILVIILTVRLLVLNMFNVFIVGCLMWDSTPMRCTSQRALYFLQVVHLANLSPGRFKMYSANYLFLILLNFDKEMGGHPVCSPMLLMSTKMFFHFVPIG